MAAAPADSSADEGWSAAERGWCVASEVYQSCVSRESSASVLRAARANPNVRKKIEEKLPAPHLFTREPTPTARPARRLPHPPLVHKVPIEMLVHLALAGPRFGLAQPALAALEGQELQIQDGEGVRARSAPRVTMFSFRFREEFVSQWGFTFKGVRHSKGRLGASSHERGQESLQGRKLTLPNRRC